MVSTGNPETQPPPLLKIKFQYHSTTVVQFELHDIGVCDLLTLFRTQGIILTFSWSLTRDPLVYLGVPLSPFYFVKDPNPLYTGRKNQTEEIWTSTIPELIPEITNVKSRNLLFSMITHGQYTVFDAI